MMSFFWIGHLSVAGIRNPTKTSLSKITATKNNLGEYIGSHTHNWEYKTNI